MAISRGKALEVAEQCSAGDVIIAADTVVCLDGDILGKPRDEAEAADMLRRLSGREHEVYTGVTVMRGGDIRCSVERTLVRFRPLTPGRDRCLRRHGRADGQGRSLRRAGCRQPLCGGHNRRFFQRYGTAHVRPGTYA